VATITVGKNRPNKIKIGKNFFIFLFFLTLARPFLSNFTKFVSKMQ